MSWYCAIGGQRVGPVEAEQVRSMIQGGQLRVADLVWSAAHGPNWVRVETVPDFAPLFAPPPLPPPVPVPPPVAPQAPAFPAGQVTPSETLMAQAREALAGRWGEAIGAYVLLALVGLAANIIPYVGWILGLLIGGPVALGTVSYFLATARRQSPQFGKLFSGFERFGPSFVAYILTTLFTLLWALLLIVPGIIAAYRYAMTFYILEDNPSMTGSEAMRRSIAMMDGHKARLFGLHVRFIGWVILCILTLGLGFVVLMPYLMTSTARFYDDLRGIRQAGGASPV